MSELLFEGSKASLYQENPDDAFRRSARTKGGREANPADFTSDVLPFYSNSLMFSFEVKKTESECKLGTVLPLEKGKGRNFVPR